MSILLKNGRRTDNSKIDLLISEHFISDINPINAYSDQIIDLKDKHILNGIIDPHVHMRDMKQSYKEDWQTGTLSALKGGITTVIDMPNTLPPSINKSGLIIKRNAAKKSYVNFGFNIGYSGNNIADIKGSGKFNGIKVFLCESSGGIPIEKEKNLKCVFEIAEELNIPVIFHSELGSCINKYSSIYEPTIKNHHQIRNRKCAINSTELILNLAEKYSCAIYFAHIATAEEIDLIESAKKSNKKIFCEITPHHLLINRKILEYVENWGKVNPPIRDIEDNNRIYKGILDGTVDTIGTDHAPHSLEEKNRDYLNAPSGFPGFETLMPLLLNEVNIGKLSLKKLEQLTSTNTANIFNINKRGLLKTGNYADLTIVDLNKSTIVDPEKFQTKAKYSPFIGMELKGEVYMTIVNGKIGYHNGNYFATKGKEIDYKRT